MLAIASPLLPLWLPCSGGNSTVPTRCYCTPPTHPSQCDAVVAKMTGTSAAPAPAPVQAPSAAERAAPLLAAAAAALMAVAVALMM